MFLVRVTLLLQLLFPLCVAVKKNRAQATIKAKDSELTQILIETTGSARSAVLGGVRGLPSLTNTRNRKALKAAGEAIKVEFNSLIMRSKEVQKASSPDYFRFLAEVLHSEPYAQFASGVLCFTSFEVSIAVESLARRLIINLSLLVKNLEASVQGDSSKPIPQVFVGGGAKALQVARRIFVDFVRLSSMGRALNRELVGMEEARRGLMDTLIGRKDKLLGVILKVNAGASWHALLKLTDGWPETLSTSASVVGKIVDLPLRPSSAQIQDAVDEIVRLNLFEEDLYLAVDLLYELLPHFHNPAKPDGKRISRALMRLPVSTASEKLEIPKAPTLKLLLGNVTPALQLSLKFLSMNWMRSDNSLAYIARWLKNLSEILSLKGHLSDQAWMLMSQNYKKMSDCLEEMKALGPQEKVTGVEQGESALEDSACQDEVSLKKTRKRRVKKSLDFKDLARNEKDAPKASLISTMISNTNVDAPLSSADLRMQQLAISIIESVNELNSQGVIKASVSGQETLPGSSDQSAGTTRIAGSTAEVLEYLSTSTWQASAGTFSALVSTIGDFKKEVEISSLANVKDPLNTLQGLLEAAAGVLDHCLDAKGHPPSLIHLHFLRSAIILSQAIASKENLSSEEVSNLLHWYEVPAQDSVVASRELLSKLSNWEEGASLEVSLASMQWLQTLLLDPLVPQEILLAASNVDEILQQLSVPSATAMFVPSIFLIRALEAITNSVVNSRVDLCLSVHDGISREFFGGVLDSRPFPGSQAPQKQKKAKGSNRARSASSQKAELSRVLSAHSPEQLLRLQQRLSLFLKTLKALDLQCGLVSRALDLDGEGEGLLQRFARSLEGPGEDITEASCLAKSIAHYLLNSKTDVEFSIIKDPDFQLKAFAEN